MVLVVLVVLPLLLLLCVVMIVGWCGENKSQKWDNMVTLSAQSVVRWWLPSGWEGEEELGRD